MKELVEVNRASGEAAVETPFGQVAPAAEGGAAPGMKSAAEIVKRLQDTLKLSYEPTDTKTQKWQKFINALGQIKGEDVETQQLLSGLRYGDGGWYTVDVGLLQNPQYT
ncbi:MAG: hypothetical protein PHV11_00390 [Candidatus Bipolaricaulis sp.]|nr:hypothetical protein [Candidatus Bipolaricaulis sp.]